MYAVWMGWTDVCMNGWNNVCVYNHIHICTHINTCVCGYLCVWLCEVGPRCPAGASSAGWPEVDAMSSFKAPGAIDPCPAAASILEPNKPSTKPLSTWACMAMEAF